MNIPKFSVVILAAGKGTRMQSNMPKVLHPLAGKPLVEYVINTALMLHAQQLFIVYGYGAKLLQAKLAAFHQLNWVEQTQQLGTGHALQQVMPYIEGDENILILYGDVPLISAETLHNLLTQTSVADIVLLSAKNDKPTGYGRIIRQDKKVTGIIEEKDATSEQRAITEIFTGIMVAKAQDLKKWLSVIKNDNSQQEFYLTDIISLAVQEQKIITTIDAANLFEIHGVNTIKDIIALERWYQQQKVEALLHQGVKIIDPNTFYLYGELFCHSDVVIGPNVMIEGSVTLGKAVTVGMGCSLKNSIIGDQSIIKAYSILEEVNVSSQCQIGPFAHLRPGTSLSSKVKIGNFVETKQAQIGAKSKASHLSYLGDVTIGENSNIGAGTITCNYDGINKHKTSIGNSVFVGSNSALVAPIIIDNEATIGAGSVITVNVPEKNLAVSRVNQRNIANWRRARKKK